MTSQTDGLSMNWVKIKNKDNDEHSFLTVDSNGVVNIDKINHFDSSYIPGVSYNGINYIYISPSTTQLEVGTSYTNVCLEMNGVLGSSSTVTSSTGSLSSLVVSGNCFMFSYQNSNTSDILQIKSYSPDNIKYRWINFPLTITTVLAIPTSWVSAPNTQQYQYTALQMNFSRPVTAVTTVVSTSGTVSNVSVVGGKIQFDYLTPAQATDVITFTGVDDGAIVNASPVTFNVSGLVIGPTFSNFTSAPQSQSYSYTGLEANFSKTITTCTSITASAGSNPTNVSVSNGKVLFDWTSPASASVTLTFNGLQATDGSYDSGAIETAVVNLSSPPTSASWFSDQPVLGSTAYSPQVSFDKTIASVGGVSSSGTNQPTSVGVTSGRVSFNITTDASPNVTYTITDIIATDGGRLVSTTLTTGPNITGILSNNNASVGNKVLIQAASQTVAITFSKNISNQPSATMAAGTASYVSGQGTNTIVWNLTNVTGSSTSLNLGVVIASDSTQSSGLFQTLTPVTEQTFNRIAEQSAPAISKTTFDQNTTYNLLSVFNKNISTDISGVSVTASSGSNPTSLAYSSADRYSFDWTPDTAGTITLNFNNVRDSDLFTYTLFQSPSLTVNAVITASINFDFTNNGLLVLRNSGGTDYVQQVSAVGNANDKLVSIGTQYEPKYVSNSYISWDDFVGGLKLSAATPRVYETVIMVMRKNPSYSTSTYITLLGDGNNTSSKTLIDPGFTTFHANASYPNLARFNKVAYAGGGSTFTPSPLADTTNWFVLAFNYSNSLNHTDNTLPVGLGSHFVIRDGGDSGTLSLDVKEVLMYTTQLSLTDMAREEDRLIAKHAITV